MTDQLRPFPPIAHTLLMPAYVSVTLSVQPRRSLRLLVRKRPSLSGNQGYLLNNIMTVAGRTLVAQIRC